MNGDLVEEVARMWNTDGAWVAYSYHFFPFGAGHQILVHLHVNRLPCSSGHSTVASML